MPLIIALIILVLIAFVSVKFRCFVCFNLLILGIASLIAGSAMDDSFFTTGGAVFLIGSLLIMFLTSLKVEKSRRAHYMVSLFLSGMFSFLHGMLIMMIITIPFAKACKVLSTDYQERVLVDLQGHEIGKVYVDKDLKGVDGKQYDIHDPY